MLGRYQSAGRRSIVRMLVVCLPPEQLGNPVFYEFPRLKVPPLLMIDDADTTAIGSDIEPAEVLFIVELVYQCGH